MNPKQSTVAITHNLNIGRAIEEALGHFNLKPLFRNKIVALQLGGDDVDHFRYPALDIKKAFSIFTKAAYGKAIDPEHA